MRANTIPTFIREGSALGNFRKYKLCAVQLCSEARVETQDNCNIRHSRRELATNQSCGGVGALRRLGLCFGFSNSTGGRQLGEGDSSTWSSSSSAHDCSRCWSTWPNLPTPTTTAMNRPDGQWVENCEDCWEMHGSQELHGCRWEVTLEWGEPHKRHSRIRNFLWLLQRYLLVPCLLMFLFSEWHNHKTCWLQWLHRRIYKCAFSEPVSFRASSGLVPSSWHIHVVWRHRIVPNVMGDL